MCSPSIWWRFDSPNPLMSILIYAVCPGGEGADLKSVGLKGLAGSNPVHGAKYGIYKNIGW